MFARLDNRLANFSAELDDRLVHFRLDLLFERNFPALEDLLDVRPKLAWLRADDRELLFDPESERLVPTRHDSPQVSLKNATLSWWIEPSLVRRSDGLVPRRA